MLFEDKFFKFFYEFFYGVFKVRLTTQRSSTAAHCSAIQNSIIKLNLNSADIALLKQICLCLFQVLAGIEIFIFHQAPNSGTSILYNNFVKNMFLRTHICPFTNGQICKRTNNLPIDK